MSIGNKEQPFFPVRPENDQAGEESTVDIEPSGFGSFTEVARKGREEFLTILRNASTRALLRYILDGKVNIRDVGRIPERWRRHFGSAEFRALDYTWHNPKLFLLSQRSAAQLALDELVARLQSGGEMRAHP